MPRKGMRSIFFHSSPHHHSRPSTPPSSPPAPHSTHRTFSATLMEENISNAESIISKWDPEGSAFAKITSLFYESRDEARQFLHSVSDLQRAMHFFIADSPVSSSALLVRGQNLMQTAMRRLEKEFYQILSANRDCLDPESVSTRSSLSSLSLTSSNSVSDLEDAAGEEDEIRSVGESIGEVERVSAGAMADLRSIAECMISSGYGKECVKIYKTIRRSIVDEGLYKLGFEKLSPSHVQKLDWEVLDFKIRSWLAASRVAVRALFYGERVLCDHVFASSDSIRESCFAEIARDPAVQFLGFPELVAGKTKRSSEKMFRILDLYDSISELWSEIESVFSYESTSAVRSQAVSSLLKLADAVRSMFAEFESAIQKDNSKTVVPGGGLHPLTSYVMNYVALLADYGGALADIFAEYPLQIQASLPESFFDTSASSSPSSTGGENSLSPISVRIAWLILVLMCKLDGKAEMYRQVALSYLFLLNNLQYVLNKVRESKLSQLLGEEWMAMHEAKARGYAANYERLGWSKVVAAIPEDGGAEMDVKEAKERMRRFNQAFEAAYRGQAGWAVADGRMRDELRLSIARKVVPAYRAFYERCRLLLRGERDLAAVVLRFAPEDLGNHLSDMFNGEGGSVSVGSSVSGSPKGSWRPV